MARKASAKDNLQENLFRELRAFAEQCGIEVRCEKLVAATSAIVCVAAVAR